MFGLGEKIREIENKEENNPFEPTFFCPPNFRGKLRGKDTERCNLHKYPHFITLTYPSHFPITLVTYVTLLLGEGCVKN